MLDLIDVGVNLAHESFDRDREEVIERAATAGIARMIVTGTSVTASVQACALAAQRPGRLFASAGIHPHHANEADAPALDAIRGLLAHPQVVAVGECGLDFFRNFSPPEAQQRAFSAQLELAASSGLPLFLHQREAHDVFLRLIRPWRSRIVGAVAHCFTGGPDELRDYLELDLYIGITGWLCDERRGGALREALPGIPMDRLLVETDAPYLLPRDLPAKPRGRRNEPSFLSHVVERIAALLDRSVEEIAGATTRNAERLFALPDRTPGA
jgi:TatD DNase family protein